MDANDILTLLMPVPPTPLIRKKEFPDCPEVFVKVAKEARNPREAGRLFSLLCRLTGFAWMVWAVNSILFSSVIITFLYWWATEPPPTNQPSQAVISKAIVATMLALLFMGKMMFYAFTTVSLQLADRCHECSGCRDGAPREDGPQDGRPA